MRDDKNFAARRRTQFVLPVRTAGRFWILGCGALNLALPATFVRGILRPEETNSASSVTALQTIYHLRDLADRLEQPASLETPESRVILLGKYDEHYAFRVDRVHGPVEMKAREMRPLPAQFQGEERGWFTGVFLFQETMACLVNLDWLLDRQTGSRIGAVLTQPQATGTEILELEVASDGDDAPWADS
jgi:hypothetical protein